MVVIDVTLVPVSTAKVREDGFIIVIKVRNTKMKTKIWCQFNRIKNTQRLKVARYVYNTIIILLDTATLFKYEQVYYVQKVLENVNKLCRGNRKTLVIKGRKINKT